MFHESHKDETLSRATVCPQAAAHAVAAAAAAALHPADIRIGFPEEFFVRCNIPASIREDERLAKAAGVGPLRKPGDETDNKNSDYAASPHIQAKLAAAKARLAMTGFTVVEEEWGEVASGPLGPVNALYQMTHGFESAPGEMFQPWGPSLSTLTGQMAAWMDQYLEPTDVTVRDICDDIRPVGDHNPAGMMASSANEPGSESAFRMYGKYSTECTVLWNQYFEDHAVDFICTNSTWADVETYAEMARGDGDVNVKQLDESYAVERLAKGRGRSSFWSFAKQWAVPKLLVPLGCDSLGRPVSCTLWGKAVPPEHLYDDEFVKTWDLGFMHRARRAVVSLHADPALRRVEPPLTADVWAPKSSRRAARL